MYIQTSIGYFETDLFENIWIELSTVDGKLLICNVYRPPNFYDYWVHFEKNIDTVKSNSP